MKKAVVILTLLSLITVLGYRLKTTETALANGIVRLHVIANSDAAADQQLKLKVRDAILNETKEKYKNLDNADGVYVNLESDIEYIEQIAKNVIISEGYDYNVNVVLGKSYFPRKSYGNITLPEGNYNALKVEIGNAKGKNWWCVLFPPLCFVDEACVKFGTQGDTYMKENLDPATYAMVTEGVEFKLKSYEIWQNGKRLVTNVIHYLKN